MKHRMKLETTSMSLHMMAMLFMLCDHLWATVIPGNEWLTCVGRLAFPIFAFLIVEGYFHTSNLKKYVGRLLLFAILSEIPFNLVMGSTIFYPLHQNVIWTFLIAILLIRFVEKVKEKGKFGLLVLAILVSILAAILLGLVTLVDYHFAGILTVLTFYFFRGKRWWNYVAQFIVLYYINIEILGGYCYEVGVFGNTYYLVQQGFALLALLPIWLYKGKQGPHNKVLQYTYYAFYPVHLLILGLIQMARY